uniref:Peptidase S54 rhomboid domain-containing protein n=1 Tax=uncultured Bacteroidota bacterium TaxID=152509 RepID=H5SM97_9BACT|nr:hypothetical protein HGMM_F50B04C09 [uncultured Bacteroidetes bacterium]
MVFAGVMSCVVEAVGHALLQGENTIGIGFSGVVSGVITASLADQPTAKLLGFIPAWIVGIVFVIQTLHDALFTEGRVSEWAHLGGAIGGILFVEMVWG